MNNKATLLFIRGIPGSGKSFVSTRLVKSIKGAVLLDPDAIDYENPDYIEFSKQLSKEGLDTAIHPFRWLRKQACEKATPGAVVIWNQPFTNRGVFDRLVVFIQNEAQKNDVDVQVLVLEVNTPAQLAYERIQARIATGGHGPTSETFKNRVENYASFEDGHTTLQLDGTQDIDILVQQIIDNLKSHS